VSSQASSVGERDGTGEDLPAGLFDDTDPGGDLTWGVGAVSKRLEITASTLRTWERRYGVGPSFRTRGGHRRYTDEDIDRVALMQRLVDRDVSAQDAARVTRALDKAELDTALTDEVRRDPAGIPPGQLVDALMETVVAGDLERLSRLLGELLRAQPATEAWRDVLSPTLVRMTSESSAGTLRQDSESAAISVIVAELRARVIAARLPETGRTGVLVARNVPAAEAMPLFALKAAMSQAGVTTRAVGPEVGTRLVATMAAELRPDILLTWGHPLDTALRRTLERLDGTTTLVRGYPAWPHELSLRFGPAAPIATNLGGAVELLLERVT
jgi:DNA-binding transcriptional MerR regulator